MSDSNMQASINVAETLRANEYYLMTSEAGNEVYDEGGNLLLYQADSGNCLSVPNTEEVRKLYDLPLTPPEIKEVLRREDIAKPGNVLRIPCETNQTVWVGHKTDHSMKATKMLIELFDSPKYQAMMKNPTIVKLKVWEQIASDLEAKGFKIATNPRDAGLRTFQKWRNMERTYLKYLKTSADDNLDDKRRKKPYFFDDLHPVMSKRPKDPTSGNSVDGDDIENVKEDDDEADEEDIDAKPECELLKRKRVSDLYGTDEEAFPRHALSMLISLVISPKYDERLKDPSCKSLANKTKVWESIYMDMMKEGWQFGNTVREGALVLFEKWRMVEKSILKKKLCGPRKLYTHTLRKAMLSEIEKRKALGFIHPDDPPSPSPPESSNKKLKCGEFEPGVVETLLKIVGSGHYQNLVATSGGKRANIWEKIYDDVESKGYQIAGATRRDKIGRLFQKWRNMKRTFVKYQVSKFKGEDTNIKKPTFYEEMFKIISKDVESTPNPDCDSDEESKMDEWDEEPELENPTDFLELSQMDHDYGNPSTSNEATLSSASQLPGSGDITWDQINTTDEAVKHSSSQCMPLKSGRSRSYVVLKQIKSLQETSLAMQQQNFTKIISLFESQISEQKKLNTMISDYFLSQKMKSNSKNGQQK